MVKSYQFDEYKRFYFPGNYEESISFSLLTWLEQAHAAIQERGFFAVALSGGKTPLALFRLLKDLTEQERPDPTKILLFWSDERGVEPTSPDSNYHNALEIGGLKSLGILPQHIFRMKAEKDLQANVEAYEELIHEWVPDGVFDLVMLGMGDDGHTASLFPGSSLLKAKTDVAGGYIGPVQGNRMTLTFPCINCAFAVTIYIFGKEKGKALSKVLQSIDERQYPILGIGTAQTPANWIIDDEAASEIEHLISVEHIVSDEDMMPEEDLLSDED
ncbi:6-phosphogluconolactonase [Candidatus Clavichlamydia salmonicola]|uniref:6-phosphogluconolactonase n=1 Tax=Candidatus Clavichlamydia salmonicola TaxID=469812 RepID=UPI00189180D2|nr:6-phosphogluconolactonase [Candidatus Clavichlamydia salmonicola]MBF5051327.1 6-phosphogluconolactonase [Candidatus Clavichlamydia salmonicola]